MPLSAPSGTRSGGQSPLATLASGASLSGIVFSDILLRRAFQRAGLVFPSSLAGMMGLFAGTSLWPALSQEVSAGFHLVGKALTPRRLGLSSSTLGRQVRVDLDSNNLKTLLLRGEINRLEILE